MGGSPPPQANLEYKALPAEMMTTDQTISDHGIGYGDIVYITGLFTRMTGKKKNFPMVRMGNIAMLPSEKIPSIEIIKGSLVESEMYLIEAHSIGGLSGSPVFVRQTVHFNAPVGNDGREMEFPLAGSLHLLGLMHGHWDVKESEINEVQIQTVSKGDRQGVNMGIAMVVPAKKILDILNSPELVRYRREYTDKRRADQGVSIPD